VGGSGDDVWHVLGSDDLPAGDTLFAAYGLMGAFCPRMAATLCFAGCD
jgi:hypothetical protein